MSCNAFYTGIYMNYSSFFGGPQGVPYTISGEETIWRFSLLLSLFLGAVWSASTNELFFVWIDVKRYMLGESQRRGLGVGEQSSRMNHHLLTPLFRHYFLPSLWAKFKNGSFPGGDLVTIGL